LERKAGIREQGCRDAGIREQETGNRKQGCRDQNPVAERRNGAEA